MITTMLTTITAAPTNIVQRWACIASDAAVMTQAHANAKVAITGRASCDILGLARAAASTSKIATSAKTLNRPSMALKRPPSDSRAMGLITDDVRRTENLPQTRVGSATIRVAVSNARSSPTPAIALSSSSAHGITLNVEQPASM